MRTIYTHMNCANNKFSLGEKLLIVVIWLSAIVSVFSFCCIVLILLDSLFHEGWTVLPTRGGVYGLQQFWNSYRLLLKALAYSLTLFVAAYTIKKYIDVETCRAIGEIRSKFIETNKMDLHTYLLQPEDREPILKEFDTKETHPNAIIFDYLGTIELGAIMLKRKIISLDEFNNQFGYRVSNVYNNEALMGHVLKESNNYEYLLYAIDRMDKAGLLDKQGL